MQIQDATDFSLKYTLESGQSFRWNRIDNAYYGVVGGTHTQNIARRDDAVC